MNQQSLTEPSAPQAEATTWVMRGTPAYRRIGFALFLAGFSTFSLLYCVQPLLPMFTEEFAIGPAASSLALSLSTGLLAISILCAGALSQRVGRRGLMFVSMTLAAVFNLLAACAPTWHGLLVMRALGGLALGGVPAVAMAYLAEEIHPASLGLTMGLYVGGTAFGGMIGRVGMGMLGEAMSWRAALMAISIVDLAAALAFVLMLPASRHFVASRNLGFSHHFTLWRRHLSNSALRKLFAVGCLVMGVFVTIYNYAGFRLAAAPFSLTPTQTSLIFCAYLFGIVASSLAGALADRFGRPPVLRIGILVTAAGLALTLAHTLLPVVAGIVLLTIGFFITHSVASGWVGGIAEGAKGHASALYLLAYYLGSSVLGSIGGGFWQMGGWNAVGGYAFVMLALCIGLALSLRGARAACGRPWMKTST
ncbi:MAG TPA: MFS transporter [Bordetella sp.]